MLGAAFIAGLLGGAAGERLVSSRWTTNQFPPPGMPTRGSRMPPGGFIPKALERLNLTPEQRRAIDGILERRRQQTDSLFGMFLPQMRATADSMRREIRAVLTPEQQAELDRWLPPEGFGPGFGAPFGPPGRSRDTTPPERAAPFQQRNRTPTGA